jgi:phosphoglycerol transferase MdoB-like AlkP superfamily enzyme
MVKQTDKYCSFITQCAKSLSCSSSGYPLVAIQSSSGKIIQLARLFLMLLGALYIYSLLMASRGGFATDHLHEQWIEVILVLYLYTLTYAILKPVRQRALLATIPIFLFYLLHDLFYLVYGKVFRFINFAEVPELLQILPWPMVLLLIVIFVSPMLWILMVVDYQRPLRILVAILPLASVITLIQASPTAFADNFKSIAHEIVKYSDGKSVENNGRLAMLVYREAQRAAMLDKIEPFRHRSEYEQGIEARIKNIETSLNPRNVHLIVLESFLDPRLFDGLKFSRSPAHPEFEKYFSDKLGLSISPVFGGATAQAEFEILCGVPAFEMLSSVEFNAFTGSPAWCLPGLLNELQYRTTASNAYKPNFFNAIPGYKGIGFTELHFPTEFYAASESYMQFGDPGVEDYLFDGDLFEQNFAFVQQHLRTHKDKPLFNYIMTIYGHTPHVLDPKKHPEIIQTFSEYSDDHLQRVTNQFYYRTQAIANYVNKLITLDKNSLIILVSDHVPPLRNGPNTFNTLHYANSRENAMYYNRIAVVENGKVVRYSPIHHYELPDIVLNYLTGGNHCRQQNCAHLGQPTASREERLDAYMALMAHASE